MIWCFDYSTNTGQAFLLLLCGLILRLLLAAIVVVRNGFNWKEKLFVAIAWLPKATVQVSCSYFHDE